MKRVVFGTLLFGWFLFLLFLGHVSICLCVILVEIFLFRELSAVRYKEDAAKKVPLFRTLMWGFFSTALFYSYGDFLYSFQLLAPYQDYHGWFSFSAYVCVFVLSVLSFKKVRTIIP